MNATPISVRIFKPLEPFGDYLIGMVHGVQVNSRFDIEIYIPCNDMV